VHLEFHIWLGLLFSVYNKHQIVTIICDAILIYLIAQYNDIGDGSGAEPYSLVVALHRCLSITNMVPLLLLSRMLEIDLLILLTKDSLQKIYIVE
jgi:hypothetical protein